MKQRSFLFVMMCLCALCGVQAQTLVKGNKFWDGETLYTLKQIPTTGIYYFTGVDAAGNQSELTLTKDGAKPGVYKLSPSQEGAVAPYGCLWGAKVQYVREGGMNFLAFYVEENTIGQTAILTPDNLESCLGQQQFAERESNPMEQVSDWLMNQHYLRTIDLITKQLMLDKLKGKQRKTVIERTNQQLIAYACVMGLDGQETGDGPEAQTFRVSTPEDFLEALGCNRTVIVSAGVKLNLTDAMRNHDGWLFGENLVWRSSDELAVYNVPTTEPAVIAEKVFDGFQVVVTNMYNLTITGEPGAEIVVEPRYAEVLKLLNCRNVTIDNLNLGHTKAGDCIGGVVGMYGCRDISVQGCDLYGCGYTGVTVMSTEGVRIYSSNIRDCTGFIAQLRDANTVTFYGCDIFRNRGGVYTDDYCSEVSFADCRFTQNSVEVFLGGTKLRVESCEIHMSEGEDAGGEETYSLDYYMTSSSNNTITYDSKPIQPRRPITSTVSVEQ